MLKKAFNESYGTIDTTNISNDIYRKYLDQISKNKRQFIDPLLLDDFEEANEQFIRTFETYNNMLMEQHLLDFDDILYYAYKLLTEKPQIAKSYTRLYKYICVDEAQDLNFSQYEVLKALCKDFKNIMLVGDPKQNIYEFNGSKSEYMMEYFRKDFQPKEFEMHENFRSSRIIVEASRRIAQDLRQPSIYENSSVYPIEGELIIKDLFNEVEEAQWIVAEINQRLTNGNTYDNSVSHENIAIIARNKYVLSHIEKELKNCGIPFNNRSGNGLESESPEIKIFESGLKLIINEKDALSFKRILSLLGVKKSQYDIQCNYLEVIFGLEKEINNQIDLDIFKVLKTSWKIIIEDNERFSKAIDYIEVEMKKIYKEDSELYMLSEDIILWKNHWKKYCSQTSSGKRSLRHFRNQIALGKTQNYNKTGVTLLTVHMAKGLEYDIVFLMGLNEGVFPDYRANTSRRYKEELKNMFVALTRAKRVCYLTYPKQKMMPWGKIKDQEASRFIKLIQQ
ncbi:ATP-dependent helicase [Lysinibacillus sp. NPDC096212]|uniref:ATP-dependent helicase n=2 Tax=unclassified Lysinibacillus TaxID=2636778 RepID=UPI00382715DB